jgi:replication factor A2
MSNYVRVVGTIRTYQGKRHINASLVRIIDDPMEAFFHFNEMMAITMLYKRGPVGILSS